MFNRSVNRAEIIGRIGKDPEIRYGPSGDGITNFNVATSESWKDKSGDKHERVEWHRVVIFGKRAEIVSKHFGKGDLVAILGKIQTRKWTDRDGNEKYTTEIVISQFDGDIQMLVSNGSKREESQDQGSAAAPSQVAEEFDDDIPF
jgi:single-strand DNA-binding protein